MELVEVQKLELNAVTLAALTEVGLALV